MHLTLALLLASAPPTVEPAADAPIVTHTAVLETSEHTFVARGRGLWLPEAVAIARFRELEGLRARVALQTGDYTLAAPTWSVVLGFVGDFVIKAIGAVIVALKVCEVPGVCAK